MSCDDHEYPGFKGDTVMETSDVGLWLELFECEKYTRHLTSSGYVTLEQCARLKEDDIRAMGIDCDGYFSDGQKILRQAGELKGREKEVLQELLVSIAHTKISTSTSSSC